MRRPDPDEAWWEPWVLPVAVGLVFGAFVALGMFLGVGQ